jgi:hypothetical protein
MCVRDGGINSIAMLLNVSRRLTTGCVAHTEHRYIPRRNDDDNGDDDDARREQFHFALKKKKKEKKSE